MLGVRYVEGRPMMDTSDMYNRLGLLRLKNVYKLRMYRLLVSLLNGYFPEFYDLLLRPYLSAHNYRTRGNAFRHPLVVCGVEQRGVSSQLISLYDSVPENFKVEDTSLKILIKSFRAHLLAGQ